MRQHTRFGIESKTDYPVVIGFFDWHRLISDQEIGPHSPNNGTSKPRAMRKRSDIWEDDAPSAGTPNGVRASQL